VLDRGWQSWQELGHSCGSELHKSHGFTNKVNGKEDIGLDSSIVHFWYELDMPAVRKHLKKQVEMLMRQGVIKYWCDASSLLEQHDPHRVSFEGEEDAPISDADDDTESDADAVAENADDCDDGDDADDGDDDDGGHAPRGRRGLSTHDDDAETPSGGGSDDCGDDGDFGGDADHGGDVDAADAGERGAGQDVATDSVGGGSIEDAIPSVGQSCREEAMRSLRNE